MSLSVDHLQFRPDDTSSLLELKNRLRKRLRIARFALHKTVRATLPEYHLPPPDELATLHTRAQAALQHHQAANPNHDEYHTSDYHYTRDFIHGLEHDPPIMRRRTFRRALKIIERYEATLAPPQPPPESVTKPLAL